MIKKIPDFLKPSAATRSYRMRWLLAAVLLWTLVDIYLFQRWTVYSNYLDGALQAPMAVLVAIWVLVSIAINALLGWVLFYGINKISERQKPVLKRFFKIFIVLATVCLLTLLRYFFLIAFSEQVQVEDILHHGMQYVASSRFFADAVFIKSLAVLVMQLMYQIGQKYTPGFFVNMMMGRYSSPQTEERIIMFIDLKDSTPISEELGHQKYFLFIKDFINAVANAALQCGGDIYQYVGDEVIVTWPKRAIHNMKCIQTLILARKELQNRATYFKRTYGVVPDFRAGIHVGELTVGEIGVVKKDIAMSGEAMNTTARIRSACSELNQKHIVSEDFFDFTNLKTWQGQDLGEIQLKGIEKKNVKLYALKI